MDANTKNYKKIIHLNNYLYTTKDSLPKRAQTEMEEDLREQNGCEKEAEGGI